MKAPVQVLLLFVAYVFCAAISLYEYPEVVLPIVAIEGAGTLVIAACLTILEYLIFLPFRKLGIWKITFAKTGIRLILGFSTFLTIISFWTYTKIAIETVPSGPVSREDKQFYNEVRSEAFKRSILPTILYKQCKKRSEVICEVSAYHGQNIWDITGVLEGNTELINGVFGCFANILIFNAIIARYKPA